MEAIARDYRDQPVAFYYIYKSLAHPGLDGWLTPVTLEERLMQVREAERLFETRIPWLVDTMANSAKHALGDANNSQFVVDPDGMIVRRRAWGDSEQLRQDLADLVAPVASTSSGRGSEQATLLGSFSEAFPTDVLPRVDRPRGMRPLRVEALASEQPLYVKLRAEASRDLLLDGTGDLFLSFQVDPLYSVHWNNLAPPLQFEIDAPPGVVVTPPMDRAAKVEAFEADRDPREFLIDLAASPQQSKSAEMAKGGPLDLCVRYFACDDGDRFCIPVSQQYVIHLQRDADGGSARDARGGGFGGRGRGGRRPGAMLGRLLEQAVNQGPLKRDDVPSPLQRRFEWLDENGDELLSTDELEAAIARMQLRRERSGPGPSGGRRRRSQGNAMFGR